MNRGECHFEVSYDNVNLNMCELHLTAIGMLIDCLSEKLEGAVIAP